ncbi:MAG: radical SAM family heme chaperone HemW, partial [Candidatus Caldatribacteriota bacterium]|nr:radical SAM family heme chaperone HemW [Candidatus Caldatribacteriota bacterium]
MDLGLYLHLPFCISKCPYCDFNSYPLTEGKELEHYLNALYGEIEIYSEKMKNRNIESIYFGGGTPTVLSGLSIYNIINYCKKTFKMNKEIEITIEANPGTLSKRKLKLIYQSGVNRLSIGGQSFDDLLLKKLGRIHTVREIIESYYMAREAGFKNINIDIMYALPEQSLKNLKTTLKKAVKLKPEHVSIYGLTINPGTKYYYDYQNNLLKLPSEDEEYDMFKWIINFLKQNNYEQYEISNFALPSKRSVHNQIYWKNQEYLGIGAGAYSYLKGYRYGNIKKPVRYISKISEGKLPIDEGERLSLKKRMAETIILGLRTKEGIGFKRFRERFKIDIDNVFGTQIDKLINLKLIKREKNKIKLSKDGIFVANVVFRE